MYQSTRGNIPAMQAVTVDGRFPNFVKRKVSSRQMDFWDTFKPIYYFSRASGLVPFSIRRNSNGVVHGPKVNPFDGVWFLFTIVAFLSAAIYSKQNMELQDLNTQIHITIVLNKIHLTLSLIFGSLLIAMDMHNRFKIFKLLERFISFDNEVKPFFL